MFKYILIIIVLLIIISIIIGYYIFNSVFAYRDKTSEKKDPDFYDSDKDLIVLKEPQNMSPLFS